MNDLARHLIVNESTGYARWRYMFPNGYGASVILDARQPFRFEVAVLDAQGRTMTADRGNATELTGPSGLLPLLTSDGVEAALAEIAALPPIAA